MSWIVESLSPKNKKQDSIQWDFFFNFELRNNGLAVGAAAYRKKHLVFVVFWHNFHNIIIKSLIEYKSPFYSQVQCLHLQKLK